MEEVMEEETENACPRCGSTLIQQITNGMRCGQCGLQFNEVRGLVRQAERYESTGWRRVNPGQVERAAAPAILRGRPILCTRQRDRGRSPRTSETQCPQGANRPRIQGSANGASRV